MKSALISDDEGIGTITSVNEDTNTFFKEGREVIDEWFHPVTIHEEFNIDVHVTTLEFTINAELFLDVFLVCPFLDITNDFVAKVFIVFAFVTDIIDVYASLSDRLDKGVVAVDCTGNTCEFAFPLVASRYEVLASIDL
jgi:hypothetical protein